MQKNYILLLFFVLAFTITQFGFSQSIATLPPSNQNIEGLSIYPNPVNNGRQYIYITSKRSLSKTVEFYNVLGKKIFATVLSGKELNISKLSSGVYILKITENNTTETRKLVIK